jgi:hypothetical protein
MRPRRMRMRFLITRPSGRSSSPSSIETDTADSSTTSRSERRGEGVSPSVARVHVSLSSRKPDEIMFEGNDVEVLVLGKEQE